MDLTTTPAPITALYLIELDELLRSGDYRVYSRQAIAAELRRRTGR